MEKEKFPQLHHAGPLGPMQEQSELDYLTGILNRSGTERRIREALVSVGGHVALFLIELDGFARLQEQESRAVSDRLLRSAAAAIAGVFRAGDIVGRLEDGRFAAFLPEHVQKRLISEKTNAVLDSLELTVNGAVALTACVGIAHLRAEHLTLGKLFSVAETALWQAQSGGKRCYAVINSTGDCRFGSAAASPRSAAVQHQALLESISGGVFLADVGEQIRLTYASPNLCCAPGGELPEGIFPPFCPKDQPRLEAALRRTAESGEASELTCRCGPSGTGWQRLRISRLTLMTDGTASVIGILTDMTEFKRSEEKLRQSEERYRIADELSHTLIWEVDIASRTLYQSAEMTRTLGHGSSVFHNVPDGLIATGAIHPSCTDISRRMFAKLYAGNDSGEYHILARDGSAESYVWLRVTFRIVRNETNAPVRAIGIVEKMPGVGRAMRAYEDEIRFADDIVSPLLHTIRINLTTDAVEKSSFSLPRQPETFADLFAMAPPLIHADDLARFFRFTRRKTLLKACENGSGWLVLEFRRLVPGGDARWMMLAVHLLRHPVSRDVIVFGYCRDIDSCHRWTAAMGGSPELDAATLLYTKNTMAELSRIAASQMEEGASCAVTVFEITGLDRFTERADSPEPQKMLSTFGYLSRLMIDGNVVIGRLSETQFAVFRAGVVSGEQQRREILRSRSRARRLLARAWSDSDLNIACGFSVAEKSAFRFDDLLHQASLACRIAQARPGRPVEEYTNPNSNLYAQGQAAVPRTAEDRRTVLVADDDMPSRSVLRAILEREYAVDEAADGEQVLDKLQKKHYSLLLCGIRMPKKSGWEVMEALRAEDELLRTPVIMVTADDTQGDEVRALNLGASDIIVKPVVPEVLISRARNIIGRREAAEAIERNSLYELRFQEQACLLRLSEFDELTGLYNKQGFSRHVREKLDASPATLFCLIRFDLDNFKIVNDTMGMEAGDRLLRNLGSALRKSIGRDHLVARLEADHFVIFLPNDAALPEDVLAHITEWFRTYPFNFHLAIHMGVYHIDDPAVEVSIMCDRALLALKSVKGSFTRRIGWYDESLRSHILEEQQLSSEMVSALESGQFVLYFQPQINYESGALIGAEALVRWQHPTRGLISPGKFIPLFERNGFISTLDEYIWEQSCRYMRKWLDRQDNLLPVSISVNISRVDIYNPLLCEHLLSLMQRYDLPASYLRLEITESAYMQDPEQLITVVRKLRDVGFTVEMDDFGAGYSSLNTLKDVPVSALKLDIRFLSDGSDDARGGSILSSVIRMAHWLDMPVIAEGVETKAQADYLKSLNCFYMQGYYFGKPMPAGEFEESLALSVVDTANRFNPSDLKGIAAFWTPSAQDALLFNSLVGGAAILEYSGGNLEILRANDKFYSQIGTTRENYMPYLKHTLDRFDAKNRSLYIAMLEEAIRSNGEAECDLWSEPFESGGTPFWTHNRVRLLATNADGCLFYLSLENITARKELEEQLRLSREELQLAVSRMGKLICRYDIPSRTLTLPEEYARKHHLSTQLTNVPDRFDLVPLLPKDYERYRAFYYDVIDGKDGSSVLVRLVSDDAGFLWERHEAAIIRDGAGDPVRAVISVEDVTAQAEREAESQRNHLLLEQDGACLFDYDFQNNYLIYQTKLPGKGTVRRIIPAFTLRMRESSRIPPDSLVILLRAIESASHSPGQGILEFRADLWDTGIGWCRTRYSSIPDMTGRIYRCIGQVEDIRKEREREEFDRRIAASLGWHDSLSLHDSMLPECALGLLCCASDAAAAIEQVLKTAGAYYHAHRAYIFREAGDGQDCLQTFEWCAEGVAYLRDRLREVCYDLMGGRTFHPRNFDENGIFFCRDTDTLPSIPRDFMRAQGIRSFLQFAVMEQGIFRGVIGFDNDPKEQQWSAEQIATLQSVARLLSLCLSRTESACPPGGRP